MSIGIALSGGGIKSFSQLPVLDAFSKKGVSVSAYSGTSMGSAIAALAACGLDNDVMIPLALSVEQTLIKRRVFTRPSIKVLPFAKERLHGGYVDGATIEAVIDEALAEHGMTMLSDVKTPLAIPAVDLVSGKLIVFVSHPELFKPHPDWVVISNAKLSQAIRASCSFPFVVSAMPFRDMLLVDGGVKMNLPLELIEAYGVQKTVAVTMHQEGSYDSYDKLPSLINRIIDLMAESRDELIIKKADVHINIPLNNIWVFDFGKGADSINEGEKAMETYQKSLDGLIQKPSLWERILGKL